MKMRFSLTLLAALLGGAMGGYWLAGKNRGATR